MEAYEVYNNTKKQFQESALLAQNIIEYFQKCYGICFPVDNDPFMNLYGLIGSDYRDILIPLLEQLNYTYEPEIQYMLAHIDARSRMKLPVVYFSGWKMFYSLDTITRIQDSYVLDTKMGTLITTPIIDYSEDKRVKEYANRRSYYGFCHDASEQFLRENPEYESVTSLIPLPFGKQQYHSYVRHDGKILDFAYGACIEESQYNKFMGPIPLNTVYGYELDSEMSKLGKDEIGPEKCLLLRLAVAKQRKM